MALDLSIEKGNDNLVNIKVIGVGGGGGNAINRMVELGIECVDFVAINTDLAVLEKSRAGLRLQIGAKLTEGRGAGGLPEVGKNAAEESKDDIQNALRDTQMVFVTAGMGGGTGTGAAPVVARIAKDLGILTVGIVTKPFAFEGQNRMNQAESGISELKNNVDALIIIPNERLRLLPEQKITMRNAFAAANDILRQGVKSISDLINLDGFINLDFADVCSVMRDAGCAHMGIGYGNGKDKVKSAIESAISSPLLETSIDGARGVIMNLTVNPDETLEDIDDISNEIKKAIHEDAEIIWGIRFDETIGAEEIQLSVIATGLDGMDSRSPEMNNRVNSTDKALSELEGTSRRYSQNAQPIKLDIKPESFIRHDDDEDDFDNLLDFFNKNN